jgi:hypothetical protein
VVAVALLALHATLLALSAAWHTPSNDEVGHLAAGISHWHFGRFDLFRVNPPLVRLLATLPVVAARPAYDWRNCYLYDRPEWTVGRFASRPRDERWHCYRYHRAEWNVGEDFVVANGSRSLWYFTLARWACIPLSILGGYICFRWAQELYGGLAGIGALVLWCFCPNILGLSQMITPDAGATALGIAAAYSFWHWLRTPSWRGAIGSGVVLGITELSKTTWIILFLLWPFLWLVWRWQERAAFAPREWFRQLAQVCLIMVLAIYVLNAGYRFDGSFQRLGDFQFTSLALRGPSENAEDTGLPSCANRFANTWLGAIPVPLPRDYVLGIDIQKEEFETGMYSYLRGEWRLGGWWYYYLYALAIKVPLGVWMLVCLGVVVRFRSRDATYRKDETFLLAHVVAVLLLVSSQTGFNHHLRYVLPVLPFGFIWISRLAGAVAGGWKVFALAGGSLIWAVGSSLGVYPHNLAYFNELVGGPTGGHAHLLNSNIDCGQDLLFLKDWLDDHPEARPLGLAYSTTVAGIFDPKIIGLESMTVAGEPKAGWYAISVNRLHDRSGKYAYFLGLRPVARAGYSIYIYHLAPEEAERLRSELESNG